MTAGPTKAIIQEGVRACLYGMDADWPLERPKPLPVSPGLPLPPGAAPVLPTVKGLICD